MRLKTFSKFTRKEQWWSLVFNKIAVWKKLYNSSEKISAEVLFKQSCRLDVQHNQQVVYTTAFYGAAFSNFLKYLCSVFLPITWKSCYCLYSLNVTSKYHMSGVAPMVCWKKLKIKQDSDLYLKSSMLMDLCLWLKLEKTLFGLIFMLNFSFFKCNRFFFWATSLQLKTLSFWHFPRLNWFYCCRNLVLIALFPQEFGIFLFLTFHVIETREHYHWKFKVGLSPKKLYLFASVKAL